MARFIINYLAAASLRRRRRAAPYLGLPLTVANPTGAAATTGAGSTAGFPAHFVPSSPRSITSASSYTFSTVGGVNNADFGESAALNRLAQTFTAASDFRVASITFDLAKVGTPTDSLQVQIFATDGAGAPTGSALATSTAVAGSSLTTSQATYSFYFLAPYSFTAGTRYAFVLARTGALDGANFYLAYGNAGSSYSAGTLYRDTGSWTDLSFDAAITVAGTRSEYSSFVDSAVGVYIPGIGGGGTNYVAGKLDLSLETNATQGNTHEGPGLISTNASGQAGMFAAATTDFQYTGGFSMYWRGVIFAESLASFPPLMSVSYTDTDTAPYVLAEIGSNGSWAAGLRLGWNTGGTLGTGGSFPMTSYYGKEIGILAVFDVKSSTVSLYINGVGQENVGSAFGSGAPAVGANPKVQVNRSVVSTRYPNAVCTAAYFWKNRTLSSSEATALEANPYAIVGGTLTNFTKDVVGRVDQGGGIIGAAVTTKNVPVFRLTGSHQSSVFYNFGDNATFMRGQSFTVGSTGGNITSIDHVVGIGAGTPADQVKLDIYRTDASGLPTGSSLGTSASQGISGASVFTFTFGTPVPVQPNTKYAVVISRTGAQNASNYYVLYGGNPPGDYSGGTAILSTDGTTFVDGAGNDFYLDATGSVVLPNVGGVVSGVGGTAGAGTTLESIVDILTGAAGTTSAAASAGVGAFESGVGVSVGAGTARDTGAPSGTGAATSAGSGTASDTVAITLSGTGSSAAAGTVTVTSGSFADAFPSGVAATTAAGSTVESVDKTNTGVGSSGGAGTLSDAEAKGVSGVAISVAAGSTSGTGQVTDTGSSSTTAAGTPSKTVAVTAPGSSVAGAAQAPADTGQVTDTGAGISVSVGVLRDTVGAGSGAATSAGTGTTSDTVVVVASGTGSVAQVGSPTVQSDSSTTVNLTGTGVATAAGALSEVVTVVATGAGASGAAAVSAAVAPTETGAGVSITAGVLRDTSAISGAGAGSSSGTGTTTDTVIVTASGGASAASAGAVTVDAISSGAAFPNGAAASTQSGAARATVQPNALTGTGSAGAAGLLLSLADQLSGASISVTPGSVAQEGGAAESGVSAGGSAASGDPWTGVDAPGVAISAQAGTVLATGATKTVDIDGVAALASAQGFLREYTGLGVSLRTHRVRTTAVKRKRVYLGRTEK